MPDYVSNDVKPIESINVQFATMEEKREFLEKLGYDPDRSKSIWYPAVDYAKLSCGDYQKVNQNKFPIYVISKGRWEKPLTANALEKLGIDFRIAVEPQESDKYREKFADKVLVTPFSNLGQGSIPVRNFVWDHALSLGFSHHWVLDDNMDGFYCLNDNKKFRIKDFNPFEIVENWVAQYQNVRIAGKNYEFFADRRAKNPPIVFNTRVYSCIFIDNLTTHRWRGRYNEDTDLSLRVLKDGDCTALFNYVLAKKMPTMTMKGGNTDELYKEDGRLKMAQYLVEQHPDVASISWKWGRHQHHVDYSSFKHNRLIKKGADNSQHQESR